MTFKYNLRRGRRLFAIISVLTLLVIAVPVILFLKRPKTTVLAGWFDDTYSYRQKITFTHNADITTDRRISITVDTATLTTDKMQADCDDTRFTDQNGKLLRYKVVSGCDTATTAYDVVFPVTVNGTNVAYIYYGNPAAVTGQDPTVSGVTSLSPNGGSPTVATEEQTPGPVSYWKFDEGNGSTTADGNAGSNNSLTIANALWRTEDLCLAGKCLYFDGNGDVASKAYSGDTELLPSTTSFTVSAWFKHSSTAGADTLISRIDGVNGVGWKIYMDSSGFMCFGIDQTAGTFPNNSACTTASYADSIWHHITAVKTGTTSIAVFVDGKQGGFTGGITSSTLNGTSAGFRVGNDADDGTNGWVGFIDEVKYYSFAKTGDQILTEYNSRSATKGTSVQMGDSEQRRYLSDGLVAYWKLEEASDATRLDSSGNSNTLTETVGDTIDNVGGKFGSGGDFENSGGEQETLSIADASQSGLDITGNMTMCAWIKPETIALSNVIGKFNSPNLSYAMHLQADGRMTFYISPDGTNYQQADTNVGAITTGVWTNVCMVYDGSYLRPYINGYENGEPTNYTSGIFSGAADVIMGGAWGDYYDGVIDEVRIYNRALAPTLITDLYAWGPKPIGWWKFDENNGTTAYDSSGNGFDAGLVGKTAYTQGVLGSAFDGDGSTGYANASSPTLTDNMTQFTVSAWVNSRLTNAGRVIDKQNSSNANGWKITLGSTGLFTFTVDYDTQDLVVLPDNGIPANTWSHIEVTWDGTPNATGVQTYINGVQQNTWQTQQNGTTTRADDNAQSIGIGGRVSGGAGTRLNAKIDDVRIYNYVRSPSQVLEDMNGGQPSLSSPLGSYAGYWKFDELSGTTAYDLSNNHINLTLADATDWSPDGKFGGAFLAGRGSRDASASNTTVQDYYDFTATQSFTVSAWAKSTNAGNPVSAEAILGKADPTPGYGLYFDTSGHACFGITDNATWPKDSTCSAGDFYDATWHHILGIRDTTSDKIYIYVDGILKSSVTDTTTGTLDTSSDLRIGQITNTNDEDEFQGLIDEVKIYSIALTADQVKGEYNQGSIMAMGSVSTLSDGSTATNSASAAVCIPGDTATCRGPIGLWKMDENTGATVYDTSGNGNNGILGNSTVSYYPRWTSGKLGTSLDFDGIDDTVILPDSTLFSFGNSTSDSAFSIGLWINSSNTVDSYVLHKSGEWRIRFGSNGRIVCTQTDYSASADIGRSYLAYPTSGWHFVECTYDGSRTSTGTKIYVDGVRSDTANETTGTYTAMENTSSDIELGTSDSDAHLAMFRGKLDNLFIYDYVRTPAQIAWDYNRGGPVAWYKFDECQGTTITNWATIGNNQPASLNGTLTIGPSGTNNKTGSCTGNTSDAWYNGRVGKFNSALSVDADDDYVAVTDNATLDFTTDMSVAAWVYSSTLPSVTNKNLEIVNKWLTGTNQRAYRLYIDKADNSYNFYVDGDCLSGATTAASAPTIFTTGTWHHLVGTFTNSKAFLYVDGKLENSSGGSFSSICNSSSDVVIGMDANKSSTPNSALIDDVRLYNYALNVTQVKTLMNDNSAVRYGPVSGTP